MRWKQSVAVALVVGAAALGACKDSTEPNPCAPFEGTWNATTFTYTSNANSQIVVNALNLGASISITADDNCTYTGTAVIPTVDPTAQIPIMGTFTVNESSATLTLAETGALAELLSQTYDYTVTSTMLTLIREDATFDFNQDGETDPTTESATLTLVLAKQ